MDLKKILSQGECSHAMCSVVTTLDDAVLTSGRGLRRGPQWGHRRPGLGNGEHRSHQVGSPSPHGVWDLRPRRSADSSWDGTLPPCAALSPPGRARGRGAQSERTPAPPGTSAPSRVLVFEFIFTGLRGWDGWLCFLKSLRNKIPQSYRKLNLEIGCQAWRDHGGAPDRARLTHPPSAPHSY